MIGQNIGKYRVLDRIGRGGMGTVYRAIDETLHREVAIKVLNAELNDPSVARRFRAEAVTVARLNHPGIATVYELFQHEGQWLMVMEFVRGETLEALVTRKGPLDPPEAVELCMQALAALAHAHSLGVVHRDLKPANIMFTESGTVKVMDFGIARVVGTEHLTSAGFMMGTPAYMAPEQVLGEDIDARADLYAMGVVLYHLLTGQLPFKGHTPFEMAQSRLRDQPTPIRTVRAEVPEWLETVLGMSIHREPAKRFQSAPNFRESLRRGLANLPLETPESSVIPPELVATAAPSSMAVASASAPTVTPGAPVQAEIPKVPPPPPVDSVGPAKPAGPVVSAQSAGPIAPAKPGAASPAPSTSSRTPMRLGLAAAIVVMAAILAWMMTRAPRQAPPPQTTTAAASTASPTSEPPPAPAPPDAPAPTPEPGTASAPAGGPTSAPISGPASIPGASVGGMPESSSVGTAATGRSGTASPTPGRSGGAAATGAAARRRGRGAVADTPADFKDVRLLVVVGNRAEEQPGVLNFSDGRVAVIREQSGATLVSIPYSELSYAFYTRAKDPKWSPVLAAPPGNVDLPSGLFSPARHWLTLQSRGAFLIARLSDANWRQVLQTVTARTGLEVEHPAASQ
jgi:serine/threonine protein kinase